MTDYQKHLSRAGLALRESAIRRAGDRAMRTPDAVSFAPGYPEPESFAWEEFAAIAREVLSGADPAALQYGPTRGYPPLLAALPEVLAARGIRVMPQESIVTTGSQQGLDLCARVFIDPGDTVLVELPTYTGGITAFSNAQARLVGVNQDEEGIDLHHLDATLHRERTAGRRVAFVYVVPNFQNPSGLLMSRVRRTALLDWALRRDVMIVEDDPYGALYFDDVATAAETRPVKADDPDGRVVYLSSFSKTIAPGFRVAWITAAAPIVSKLEIAKQSADLCTGALDQRMVYEVVRRRVLDACLPRLRARYQDKRTAMEQALRRELGGTLTWTTPKGGFFLWATFPEPVDTDVLLDRAIHHGVVFVPGSAFYIERREARHARLSFSTPGLDSIRTGVERLAGALREELASMTRPAKRAAG
jgi:2-aminoadipate transaminase